MKYLYIGLAILIVGLFIGADLGIQSPLGSGGESVDPTAVGTGATTADPDITFITDVTDDFAIGGNSSSAALFFDESAGDLTIDGDLTAVDAVFSGNLTVVNATTSGDLVILGGDLNKDATGLTIGGDTTTTNYFIIGSEDDTVTTTASLKTDGTIGSCIEMIDVGTDAMAAVYVNNGVLIVTAGTCK